MKSFFPKSFDVKNIMIVFFVEVDLCLCKPGLVRHNWAASFAGNDGCMHWMAPLRPRGEVEEARQVGGERRRRVERKENDARGRSQNGAAGKKRLPEEAFFHRRPRESLQ